MRAAVLDHTDGKLRIVDDWPSPPLDQGRSRSRCTRSVSAGPTWRCWAATGGPPCSPGCQATRRWARSSPPDRESTPRASANGSSSSRTCRASPARPAPRAGPRRARAEPPSGSPRPARSPSASPFPLTSRGPSPRAGPTTTPSARSRWRWRRRPSDGPATPPAGAGWSSGRLPGPAAMPGPGRSRHHPVHAGAHPGRLELAGDAGSEGRRRA